MHRTLKLPQLVRSMPIESFVALAREADAPDDAPQVYRFTVSSEARVQRWFGIEVLSHDKAAVDLVRAKQGLSLRDDHFGDVVGICDKFGIEERALACDIVFSANARAQEIERDVNAKPRIRRFVSIRYNPLRAKLVTAGTDGQPDEWQVTRWEPIHVAFTPDPADYSVGPGRSEAEGELRSVEIEGDDVAEEVRSMCTKCNAAPCVCQPERSAPATTTTTDRGNGGGGGNAPAAVLEVGIDHSKRSADIFALAGEHGLLERSDDRKKVDEWIRKNMSVNDVARAILDGKRNAPTSQPPDERIIDAPDQDASGYSYARAIMGAAQMAEGKGEIDGVEGEFHRAILKKMPEGYAPHGGVMVPLRLRQMPTRQGRPSQRALDTKTAAAGAEAVFDQPSSEIIELLRNRAVAALMGARFVTGLTAPVPFLKATGASSGYWVGENPAAAVASSQPATGLTHLQPKTLQANVPYSRQFLALASIDVEAWIRDDLSIVHALTIDRACFHGLGSGGEPLGVYLADAVQIQTYSNVPTYAKVVDATGMAADKNALLGGLGWVTTPLLAAAMKRTPVISGAAAGFVWEGNVNDGNVAGYPARSSNQISKVLGGGADEHGIIFGNWADLVVGMWGAMEVIVDPYALKKTGMIEITTFQMADTMFRHGESFVKGTGAKPA